MLIAEARVETDRPGRYLTQLCQHLSNQGWHLGSGGGRHLRHRPGGDHGGRQPVPAEQVQVEWSDRCGSASVERAGLDLAGERRHCPSSATSSGSAKGCAPISGRNLFCHGCDKSGRRLPSRN